MDSRIVRKRLRDQKARVLDESLVWTLAITKNDNVIKVVRKQWSCTKILVTKAESVRRIPSDYNIRNRQVS